MREIRCAVVDIDHYLEEAARAKQQLDAEHWRDELRPRAMRLFAARAAKLTWSRALVKLIVEELFPDDLFTELVGQLDRVPSRQWPHVLAIAVALRHSWRRDGLAHVARRLRVSLPAKDIAPARQRASHRSRPSRSRFSGSPRPRQGSPLRFDPAGGGAHGLDWALGRAMFRLLRDGRAVMTERSRKETRQCVNCRSRPASR